jgi:hypothetical protein
MLLPNESVARENNALPGGSALSLLVSWAGTPTLTILPSPFLTTTWNVGPLPTTAVTTLVVMTTLATNKTPTIDDDRLSTAAIEGIAISAAVAVVGMIILFLFFRKRTRQSTQPINEQDGLEAAEPVELPNP